MKKLFKLLLVILIILSSFTGVSAKEGKYVIGVSLITFYNEYMQVLKAGFENKAKNMENVELIINDAQANADRQLQQIENFIIQGVDAIVLNPCQYEACSVGVKSAKKAGIPILNVSTNTEVEPDAFVGSRDENASKIAIDYITQQLKDKEKIKIVMMRGVAGQYAEVYRSKGAKEVINNNPKLELIAETNADWDRNKALVLMENWIQSYGKEIDAVYAQNDEMGLGALKAIEDAGLEDEIMVVSVDGIFDARKAVKEGRLDATVLQNGLVQGEVAIDTVIKIIEGISYLKVNYIPFELVTVNNVKDYDYIDEFMKK